ncbi:MAG: alpha-amylase [Acidimicrobiia bacterium]
MSPRHSADPDAWWREGVLYQIYPRSFFDASGDGVGDLEGILTKLDYLDNLGISGIWLSPVYPSPMRDFGYDISDYLNIDPLFGDLTIFDRLVSELHARGIRLIMDLVPNHTSNKHPWFKEASSSRKSPMRGYYIWADPAPDGGPPNNWKAAFGGSAWTFHPETGQYYLHSFLPEQPDLDWKNPRIREEFKEIMRFWFDRGVDGFRIDVVHMLAKDPTLSDDPPSNPLAHVLYRPEVHEYVKDFRRVADEYEGRMLVGETFVFDIEYLLEFYGNGRDELHLAFNFPFALCGWNARFMSKTLEITLDKIPPGARPCFMFSNHDLPRHALRFGEGSIKPACLLLLTIPGTPFLYMGEELGMLGNPPPVEQRLDPGGRDGARTPFHWNSSANAGFCAPDVRPWLPVSEEYETVNVETEEGDPHSVLSLYRRAIVFRNQSEALRLGDYSLLRSDDRLWVFRRWTRSEEVIVAVNMSADKAKVDLPKSFEGHVAISTDLASLPESRLVSASLFLPGNSAVVLKRHTH